MALFSGAGFVIMAGIIRAVTILKSGPDGAVTGSKWACRETFVSIVVSNLPVIQPLIRKCADKIGLSALFSTYARPSRNYPLASKEPQAAAGREHRNRPSHPLSIPKGTAWGSDEHILAEGENNNINNDGQPGPTPTPSAKEITVVQETVVKSEAWPTKQPGPFSSSSVTTAPSDWGQSSAERANPDCKYRFSVTAGFHDH